MKRLITLLCMLCMLCLLSPAGAEIYKSVDEEGQVIYTDRETPEAKQIPTPSPNTIQMPKPEPSVEDAEPSPVETRYTRFSITAPVDDATIRSNLGTLTLSLQLEPGLDTENGHSITVLLDGRPVVTKASQLTITLDNIDRGSHSVKARVRDKRGKSLISSNSVRFHMKRFSTQHPTPGGSAATSESGGQGLTFTPGPQGVPFTPGPLIPSTDP